MKVKAIAMGYFGHARVKPGVVFEMPESAMSKDAEGKLVLPRWVEPADAPSKKAKGLNIPGAKVAPGKGGQPGPLHDKKEKKGGFFGGGKKDDDDGGGNAPTGDSEVI